jgi:chromosomal replication initiation ATPase DnaA
MRRGQGRAEHNNSRAARPASLHLQRLARDAMAEMAVVEVVRAHGVTMRQILSRRRGSADVSSARQVAMYLLHVGLGRPQDVVGRFFRRDPSTVSYACHVIEDRRDDPEFEAEITRLESLLSTSEEEGLRHAG